MRLLFAPWIIARLQRRHFHFRGQQLTAFYSRYNTTWINERCVEIPIARDLIRQHERHDVLEIGNVLGHYGDVGHDVVDKFERGPHVTNADVCHYSPAKQYSLIVSISTFEHIGFDDDRNSRPQDALQQCERWLKPNGRILITAPLGYNPSFDSLIASGWPSHGETTFMKRTAATTWTECCGEDVLGVRYGKPFPYANGIVVITITP